MFISSANVFDSFRHYPSYEYDKTLSKSHYGHFKIKIENQLLNLKTGKYAILRLPMVFGLNSPRTTNIDECVIKILKEGSIQLTTQQRKKIVTEKRKQIISQISSTATDPKTKLPHPITRIENALDEIRFSIDPFKSVESQIEKAVKLLRPIIPLQFITIRLAFKIPGKDFGSVSQILRESIQKEEWLSDGTWVCIVTVPGGMKNDLIGSVAKRSPNVEVKEID